VFDEEGCLWEQLGCTPIEFLSRSRHLGIEQAQPFLEPGDFGIGGLVLLKRSGLALLGSAQSLSDVLWGERFVIDGDRLHDYRAEKQDIA
jgi:hypothetical protein